jgi:hypothetical protein
MISDDVGYKIASVFMVILPLSTFILFVYLCFSAGKDPESSGSLTDSRTVSMEHAHEPGNGTGLEALAQA